MKKGEVLYNAQALSLETDVPVLVVEGTLDALAHWPDSVALLGKHGKAQVEWLLASRRPVCVVLDGDAWSEGEMLALRLSFAGVRAGSVRLEPKQDPDEVPKAELMRRALASLRG
jgi:DNA primase